MFVEYGAPGDVADVRVSHVARNYARGRIERLVEPGPDRVEPPCPYFGSCGGCDWQHLEYQSQVAAKVEMLRESFARIASLELDGIIAPIAMRDPWRCRSAAEFTVAATDPPALGFLRARSNDVVPIADCLVQHPLNVEILHAMNEWLARHGAGELWLVGTRTSFAEERALVGLAFRGEGPAAQDAAADLMRAVPRIAGVSAVTARDRREQHRRLSRHVAGEEFIHERVGERTYRIGADTFFQVNPQQAARLVETMEEMARVGRGETVVDAYCGAGIFLVPLAERAGRAIGIESNPAAVRDARANLRQAGLGHATVVREKVERALPLMARGSGSAERAADGASRERRTARSARADIVVLDPPRQGCGRQVMNAVGALAPRAVVMVSCDPATLARDIGLLAEHGYQARRTVAIDMFPHTWRVESATLCER